MATTALPYNPQDKNSILSYAQKLKGSTLRKSCINIDEADFSGKGRFGQTLEKYYFLYDVNSNPEADFKDVGLELKSSPLKQLQNQSYRAKERVVLSIIDFNQIVNEEFSSSSLWLNNNNILFVFYLHKTEESVLDYKIKLVDIWEFSDIDIEIIKNDWIFIQNKVEQGKAHELSEGDTLYLGACTKGSSSKDVRTQPNNDILAKQRAYSLKQGYVNHILASIAGEERPEYGKLITQKEQIEKQTIEQIVTKKFSKYYDKTIQEIIVLLDVDLNESSKQFNALLTNAILGFELDNKIEEFEKADIIVKSVRLKENDMPSEDISFPTFKYEEIIEQEWDDSNFKDIVEQKFFFVFYQYVGNELVLRRVRFWNMPSKDRLEAQKVWEHTQELVLNGNIVKEVKNNRRITNFSGKKDSRVSHVRPHAKNADDTYPLPTQDKVTKANEYTKHCFWLNAGYVKDEIYLK